MLNSSYDKIRLNLKFESAFTSVLEDILGDQLLHIIMETIPHIITVTPISGLPSGLKAWLNCNAMFYETFICFYDSEAKPLCFSLCSQMFDDVERF